MKLTVKNTKNKIVIIKDAMNKIIPFVFSYDTKTGRAGLFLRAKTSVVVARENGKGYAVQVYVNIPGSYAVVNGKKVK